MSQPPRHPSRPIPLWIVTAGSLAICTHLGLVLIGVLAAPSGPWLSSPEGGMTPPPHFAQVVNQVTSPTYLNYLKMTHNYHFFTNRPGLPAVFFEARLKDETGKEIAVVKLPEEDANPWLRHRESLLARGLADDVAVPVPQGESVAAPGQKLKTVQFWNEVDMRSRQIKTVPEHMVPRDRPVYRPGEWSLLLARSYARYLCRKHGAASAEIIRHTRDPIQPSILGGPEPPPGAFDEMIDNFGELSR